MLRNKMWIIILLIIWVTLCDCTKRESVEEVIKHEAENVVSVFEYDDINMNYSQRGENILLMYPDGYEENPYELQVSPEFYEKNEFFVPNYVSTSEVPREQTSLFNKAKGIVVKYIKQSTVIEESDKKRCIEAVKSTEIRFGQFEEEYYDFLMVTKGNTIYINSLLSDYNTVKFCVHELVHVISNVTNKGTKYEKEYYRSSLLNEALTDIIAGQIVTEMTDEDDYETQYIDGYEVASHMIYNFDMLKTYYYSDGYDLIKEKTGRIKLDMLILLLDNNVDESTQAMISYLVNDL